MSKRILAFAVVAAGLLSVEYAFIVWVTGPYECVNCDPE